VSVLGLLDIILSLEETDKSVAIQQSNLIRTNIIITLVLAFLVGGFIWFFVYIPIAKLNIGTKEISSGNLDYKIISKSKDEIGLLAESFNKMTEDLKIAKREILEWSNGLEKRVLEKTKELKKTQQRILQIEKMASLGKLSATVAHELNNPLAGILTFSKLIQRKLNKKTTPEDIKFILEHLKMIETESDRCGKIINDLLIFSKKQRTEVKPTNLNSILEESLQLIAHHLKLNNIELNKKLMADIPEVNIDPNQIKQALLALYMNAQEAMEGGGILTVATYYNKNEKWVYIRIHDNGKGILEEIRPHIFEPFFTTKNSVKGYGLGLPVVYGIIHNHDGEIKIESEVNKGTTIFIKLPIKYKVK
jgi:two-component system NtrC family sensor kinase